MKLYINNGYSKNTMFSTSEEPSYKWAGSLPEGYTEVTGILEVYGKGFGHEGFDFKFVRDVIKEMVSSSGGFETLDVSGKDICLSLQIGTQTQLRN